MKNHAVADPSGVIDAKGEELGLETDAGRMPRTTAGRKSQAAGPTMRLLHHDALAPILSWHGTS